MSLKEIYIFSPTDVVSGGVNSLHILCRSLIDNGFRANMYYINPSEQFLKHPVIKTFDVPYVTSIEDSLQNILVVPEANTALLHQYNYVKKMVYWLGIYFYFKKPPFRFPLSIKLFRKLFATSCFYGSSKNKFHDLSKKVNYWGKKKDPIWLNEFIHISNSFYAADFIKFMGSKKVYVLHNPIREEFYQQEIEKVRKKKILFGPKTPKSVIRKIKSELPSFECIRLKHISANEVKSLYQESILFIELGNFAGRDRMPREAVLSGCVVVTSRNGSANFYNDLQLPDYYKINTNSNYINELVEKTKSITSNYEPHFSNMLEYKDYLFQEKQNFNKVVADIFQQINSIN